jgi:trk system potassium uptake protein TrkA
MRTLIAGCGRVGAGLARALLQRGANGPLPIDVTIIDSDPAAFERLGAGFPGRTVAGVGFDRDVLLRAGIERADALAAVTGSDDANLVIARLARQFFRVPQVVARLYEPQKAAVYRQLGVQSVTPVLWGIHRMAELLCRSRLDTIQSLGSGEAEIVEVEVPPLLVHRSVHELTLPGEAHVVAIHRESRTFIPTPETLFQAADRVYLVVLAASAPRLRGLLGLT